MAYVFVQNRPSNEGFMSVSYLDVQDEITDAVTRLRAANDKRVILVLPPGSRIGTSRINFRLLLREAQQHGVALDVVSGEPGVRALAASAGARTFGSVGEAERQAIVPPPPDPAEIAANRAAQAGTSVAATAATAAAAAGSSDTATFALAPRAATVGFGPQGADAWTVPGPEETTVVKGPRRRWGAGTAGFLGRLLVIGTVLAAFAGVGYGAYMTLPTATIHLQPETQTFGPRVFRIVADPAVAVSDPATGRMPAETVTLPLSESGTFNATGEEVTLVPALGTVVFTSTNTDQEVTIPEGTKVSTRDGTEFRTTKAVQIAKAQVNKPAQMSVPVEAVVGGLPGNVPVGRVTELPDQLAALFVTVNNPQPMSGGAKVTLRTVTAGDYENAVALLGTKLRANLTSELGDPANTPQGLTIYPETAALGRVTADQAAGDIVGRKQDQFTLSASADGTVLGVDIELVKSLAGQQLEAAIPPDVQSFPQTITTTPSDGTVSGSTVAYDVTASMQQYAPPDADELIGQIKGKTVSDARGILAIYGTADISIWPDFVPSIPDDPRRINLTIENPVFPR
jgi:hypothetical protein